MHKEQGKQDTVPSTCIHCDPVPRHPLHLRERVENIFSRFARPLRPLERIFKKTHHKAFSSLTSRTLNALVGAMIEAGLLREVDADENDLSLPARLRIVLCEAKRRGLRIRSLKLLGKRHTGHFSLLFGERKIFFEGLPAVTLGDISAVEFDDKSEMKDLFRMHDIPHAAGACFSTKRTAMRFSRTLGFPLVVKPKTGSLSKHTTCDIQNEYDLERAIKIAQIVERDFIVERFIAGSVYRITLVGGTLIAASRREAAHVMGDGTHTLRELFEMRTRHRLGGMASFRPAPALLAAQGTGWDDVPPPGTKIYLHRKIILSAGADIHDVTDLVHVENRILAEKVYRLCGTPALMGIDVIARDISLPHMAQEFAVLEINSIPYIDMHHYPITGTPRNVAGALLDYVLAQQ